jgi:hypothetical protein
MQMDLPPKGRSFLCPFITIRGGSHTPFLCAGDRRDYLLKGSVPSGNLPRPAPGL